ncbi:hypothetical protein G6O69_11915 [Pseudenhygromyxa sp. WMMC2535]|uniref:hypothetical protein n=1 Tax=Pseudenhygromyxa sp. WMMC2535 TaxID=2712867 RepID=UPI001553A813|nr:hypothetical protein [Pseudenhygromyxa sp. WMMC2535]NVB38538.1 hypothetical protein [Pseudenhygromyxa sp. WMMC2535]
MTTQNDPLIISVACTREDEHRLRRFEAKLQPQLIAGSVRLVRLAREYTGITSYVDLARISASKLFCPFVGPAFERDRVCQRQLACAQRMSRTILPVRSDEVLPAALDQHFFGLEPLRVLCLFANPTFGDGYLRLGAEQEVIRKALRNSPAIEPSFRSATTLVGIQEALLERDYDIVHISCHHGGGWLRLEDERGAAVPVQLEALLELFAARSEIQCLILNACDSLRTVSRRPRLPYVVAMDGNILDDAALLFSKAFYSALAHGLDVPGAFKDGSLLMRARFGCEDFGAYLVGTKVALGC